MNILSEVGLTPDLISHLGIKLLQMIAAMLIMGAMTCIAAVMIGYWACPAKSDFQFHHEYLDHPPTPTPEVPVSKITPDQRAKLKSIAIVAESEHRELERLSKLCAQTINQDPDDNTYTVGMVRSIVDSGMDVDEVCDLIDYENANEEFDKATEEAINN